MRASLENYVLKGSENAPGFPDKNPSDGPVGMFTRTFTGIRSESSQFCNDDDGTTGPLGPCLLVKPGQKVKIRLVNDMEDGMSKLMQEKATVEQYWKMVNETGHPSLDEIEWFGEAPSSPEEMTITNLQDLPGQDATFDDVNLHLHGMQIVPHLFYPQGTADPMAEWITVQPVNENPDQQCFCYVFEIPADHPQGTFFYHIHRHGSTAMQGWQGMVGFLQVGDADSPGSPDFDLEGQGIVRDEPFALWEWAVSPDHRINSTSNIFFEGSFLPVADGPDTITTMVTNNEYQPTFDMCVNETVHFRLVCAQTTTGSGIYILDEDDDVKPFHAFASDGISYSSAYEKQAVVVGPGQREGLLLQFPKPGIYRIMQQVINDFQDEGELENPLAPAAFVNVTVCGKLDPVDLSTLNFVPGMSDSITNEEVTSQVTVNFQVESLLDRAPVPQFVINGEEFDFKRITETVNASSGSEWTLASNMNYFHPFHIHVNPFQVQAMTTGYLPGNLVSNVTMHDALFSNNLGPSMIWRDTVFIPPYGQTVIRQRFGAATAWTGKTVFHCHFLDHEDQGMIAAMVIADPFHPATSGVSNHPGRVGSFSAAMLAVLAISGMFF